MSNLGRNTCPSCCCCCSECLNIARTICERARVNDRRAALRWEYLVPAKRRSFARHLTNRDKSNTEQHFLCECSFLRLKESNTKNEPSNVGQFSAVTLQAVIAIAQNWLCFTNLLPPPHISLRVMSGSARCIMHLLVQPISAHLSKSCICFIN